MPLNPCFQVVDVAEDILKHLPLVDVVSVGFSSKALFGSSVFGSLRFARIHCQHLLAATVIPWQDPSGKCYSGFWSHCAIEAHRLPLDYQVFVTANFASNALHSRRVDVLDQILGNERFDMTHRCSEILRTASQCERMDIAELVVTNPRYQRVVEISPATFKNLADTGGVEMVRLLVNFTNLTQSAVMEGLYYAMEIDDVEMAALLLVDKESHPSFDSGSSLLMQACSNGSADFVELLLGDQRFDPTMMGHMCLNIACRANRPYVLKLLLEDSRCRSNNLSNSFLELACLNGYVGIVNLLLGIPSCDPSVNENACILSASNMGHEEIVPILLSHPAVTPVEECLQVAVVRNHVSVVKLLLEDGRCNPASDRNYCIRKACESANAATLVPLLLADPRVDPSDLNNQAIKNAAYFCDPKVLLPLLNDPRVDPTFNDNALFISACSLNQPSVVHQLLQDPLVNPGAQNNLAIRQAFQNGNFEILNLLVTDSRVDPSFDENSLIIHACSEGVLDLLMLLLVDGRADPTVLDNCCIRTACANGFQDVVKLLLQDGRADPSVFEKVCLRVASDLG